MSPVIGVKLWGSRCRPCCGAIQRPPAANVKDYVAGFSFQICWVALKLLRRATGIPHPLVALAEPAQPRLAAACGDLAGTVRPDRRRVAGVGRARAALLLHVARLLRRPRAGRGRVGRTNGDRAARDSTAGETNLAGRLRCGFSRRASPRGDGAQLPRLARRRCGVASSRRHTLGRRIGGRRCGAAFGRRNGTSVLCSRWAARCWFGRSRQALGQACCCRCLASACCAR